MWVQIHTLHPALLSMGEQHQELAGNACNASPRGLREEDWQCEASLNCDESLSKQWNKLTKTHASV